MAEPPQKKMRIVWDRVFTVLKTTTSGLHGMCVSGGAFCEWWNMNSVAKEFVNSVADCGIDWSGMDGGIDFDTVSSAADGASNQQVWADKMALLVSVSCLIQGCFAWNTANNRMQTLGILSEEVEGLKAEYDTLVDEKRRLDDLNAERFHRLVQIITGVESGTATSAEMHYFNATASDMRDELHGFSTKTGQLLARVRLSMDKHMEQKIKADAAAWEQGLNGVASAICFATLCASPGGWVRCAGLLASTAGTGVCLSAARFEILNVRRCEEILKDLQVIESRLVSMQTDAEGAMRRVDNLKAHFKRALDEIIRGGR